MKILIIRIDFLGDMICTTPLIYSLKQKWPNAEIHVLANKYNAPILDNNPYVSHIHTYVYSKEFSRNIEPGKFNALINRIRLIFKLRKIHFDLGIIPNGGMNKNSIQFIKQLNIPDCRWHTPESEFDDRNNDHIANRPIIHESLSGFSLLPELKSPSVSELRVMVYPDEFMRKKWCNIINKSNRKKLGFFVSNKSGYRKWDLDKWFILSNEIADIADIFIFHDPTEKIGKQINSNFTVLETNSIQDMVAATSWMDMIVSTDSAPVHLGSALKIPVVSLFENRPEKYLRWHPIGINHILIKNGKIVNDIEVVSVKNAIIQLLDKINNTTPETYI
ncbi:MAG: glycosyltransferase family 9 protein [Enterobacteriaceae bacterium]|jgi:ADP-heptose:LPS heptosyltransferase|nr:glycosyltransferase family 9 protein [Enterobacteriaceae bacterium]